MIDPSSKLGRELKAAEEFFELAKSTDSRSCAPTIAASLSGIFHPRVN
jgi:hypothetical protein